ncbi:MAG: CHAP domain-containing protein [Solirubrobacteraceae bacterium]
MKVAPVLALLALAVPAAAQAKPRTVQQKMVRIAKHEATLGVHEVPAHSNTGPDIRRYHTAVKHARSDAYWCTIFVSWVARQAGYPLGSVGQGIVDVKNLYTWGRHQGWYFRKGTRTARPGDIAVHGYSHAGIVVRVTDAGAVYTVDANWGDSVTRQLVPLSLSGYIRLPSTPR